MSTAITAVRAQLDLQLRVVEAVAADLPDSAFTLRTW
jgi:hypothetical protein